MKGVELLTPGLASEETVESANCMAPHGLQKLNFSQFSSSGIKDFLYTL
jgi:hypothetical protein